ncbi:MAG: hypothetical protein ACRCZ9_00050 [Fusobacteriaceae bacterium]
MIKEVYFGEKFEIKSQNLESENLKDILKDFYIEKLSEGRVSLEKTVQLRSLTKDIKKINIGEKIYEIKTLTHLKDGESEIYSKLQNAPENWMLIVAVTLIILSAFLFFWRDKKKKVLEPIEVFRRKIENISEERWQYEISFALREFIDKSLGTKFLQGIYEKKNLISDSDIEFIKSMDLKKYSGKISEDDREIWIRKSSDIVDKIWEVKDDKI